MAMRTRDEILTQAKDRFKDNNQDLELEVMLDIRDILWEMQDILYRIERNN